ncbi:MAG: hypothetical protein Q9183_003011 [Haloplaca sp. 2 TL-2023]
MVFLFFLSTLITAIPQRSGRGRDRYQVNNFEDVDNTIDTTTLIRDPIDQPIPTPLLNPISESSNTDSDTQPVISSPGTGNGKRGLAFNESSPSLAVFSNSDITWVHNWHSSPGDAPSDFQFVPTLWSDESPHTDDWNSRVNGAQYLMSFNEPDIIAQANMEVGHAVDAYKRLMFPQRAKGAKISAPSVSSGSGENEAGIPMGVGWLSQFLSQCDDENSCVVDFISGHWYGCPDATCSVQDDVSSFKNYVQDLITTAKGRDVWVPEFQRYGNADGQQRFLENVLPWLDGKMEVKRYAYYMVVDGILTTNGEPNDLGNAYAAAAKT